MKSHPHQAIIELLQAKVPQLLAIYAFGSQVQGSAGPDSDLDLAVLVPTYTDPVILWELSGELAVIAHCPVDLLDFRAASTVMQYQILMGGERWWALDSQAALLEAAILSEKTWLDEARAGLLKDIQATGRVYAG